MTLADPSSSTSSTTSTPASAISPTILAQLTHIASTDEFRFYDEPSSSSPSTSAHLSGGTHDWAALKEAIKTRIVECLERDFGHERDLQLHPASKLLEYIEEGGDVEGAWARCNDGLGCRERAAEDTPVSGVEEDGEPSAEGDAVTAPAEQSTDTAQTNGTTVQYDYLSRLSPSTTSNLVHPPFVHRADVQHFYPSKRPPSSLSTTPLSPTSLTSSTSILFSMLEDFDTQPLFTIQRLCELILRPTAHYSSASKWINALKRCLSVTATRDAFPISPVQAPVGVVGVNGHAVSDSEMDRMDGLPPPAASAEPLFSPIPFIASAGERDNVPEMELGGADRTQHSQLPKEIVDAAPTDKMEDDAPPTVSTERSGSVAARVDKVAEQTVLGVPDGQVDELDNPHQRVEAISSTTSDPGTAAPEPQDETPCEQQVKTSELQQEQDKKDDENTDTQNTHNPDDQRSPKRRKSIASIHE